MNLYKFKVKALYWIAGGIAKIFGQVVPPTPSVGAIIERNDKVLLVNLSYSEGYNIPGGILEAGENLEEGLAREVREETGLSVTRAKYLCSNIHTNNNFPGVQATFVVRARGNPKASTEGALEWVEKTATPKLLVYPDSRKALELYLKND